MQKGRTEEANALAKRISKTTENRHKTQLRTRDGNKTEAKEMWAAVRQLTGRTRDIQAAKGINAETLNQA